MLKLELTIAARSDPDPLSFVLITTNGLAMNVAAENGEVPFVGSVTVAMMLSPLPSPGIVAVTVVGLLGLLLSVTLWLIKNERRLLVLR